MTVHYRFAPEPIMFDVEFYYRLDELFTEFLDRPGIDAWNLYYPEAMLLDVATETYSYWKAIPPWNTHPSAFQTVVDHWNLGVAKAKRLYLHSFHKAREMELMTTGSVEEANDRFKEMLAYKTPFAQQNRQG